MAEEADKYWYNLKTGEVEKGYESPSVLRAGPFDTAEEAARAPEIIAERSREWAEDEAREAGWGTSAADEPAADSDAG